MHRPTWTFVVLALFTASDRAAEIEGDLLEQARARGWLWFAANVAHTCCLLFLQALRAQPLAQLLLGYAVYELMVNLNWWLLRPLRLSLRVTLDVPAADTLLLNGAVNACVALLLGVLAGRLAPRLGSQVVIIAATLMLARLAMLQGAEFALGVAAFTLIPVFAGLMLAKTLELHRKLPSRIEH